MARKATPTPAQFVKVGDHIIRRNVLKGSFDLMTICQIRKGGSRIVFDYADAVTGQQVDYFWVEDKNDVIQIITED